MTSISLRPVSFAFRMKNEMLKFANANIEDTSKKNFNLESKDSDTLKKRGMCFLTSYTNNWFYFFYEHLTDNHRD